METTDLLKEKVHTEEKIKNVSNKWEGTSLRDDWDKEKEMDFTYTNIDKFIRLSLGETAHFSNAMYNGDYSLTLEQAQRKKYDFVCESLGIKEGTKVLDLGCGWGGWLYHLKNVVKAKGVGVNLSKGQVAACRKNGLEAFIKDARYVKPDDFGTFDAVTAFGSFEHAASVKDYVEGRQDEVYDSYFKHVADLLPKGGRFYMQAMVFSKNMIPFEKVDINAPKGSDEYIVALLTKHNPDSWLAYGHEHIIKAASPYFKPVFYSSGRLDYVKTNREWTKLYFKFGWKKYMWYLSLIPKLFTDKEFRHQLDILKYRPNRVCFEREIMDHARLVFEKI
jgi:cyclopropane-fatty-acyl-phospholipid synthase